MNPAPTLLNEWISAPVFWAILALLCCVALIVVTAEIFRDRDDSPTPDLEPARDVCDLEHCAGRASVIYDAHPSGSVLYICDYHATVVREWVGRSLAAPYDRENGVA